MITVIRNRQVRTTFSGENRERNKRTRIYEKSLLHLNQVVRLVIIVVTIIIIIVGSLKGKQFGCCCIKYIFPAQLCMFLVHLNTWGLMIV